MRQAAVVTVSHGDQLHAGGLQCSFCIALALNTGAYQRELYLVIGRSRRRGRGLPQQRVKMSYRDSCGGGLCSGLEK